MTRSATLSSIVALVAAVSLSGCDASPSNHSSATTQPAASPTIRSADLDVDASPLPDCSLQTMRRAAGDLAAQPLEADPGTVCRALVKAIGSPPQVRVLRAATAAVTTYVFDDATAVPETVAQLLLIAHLRRARTPEALVGVFTTLHRMKPFVGGRLTLDEVIAFLQSAGPVAHTLSDDGLFHMAPMIAGVL